MPKCTETAHRNPHLRIALIWVPTPSADSCGCWGLILTPHCSCPAATSCPCGFAVISSSQCNAGVSSQVTLTPLDELYAREKCHQANSSVCCVTPANGFSSLYSIIQADFPLTLMNYATCAWRPALPRHSSLSSPGTLGGCAVSMIPHMPEFREGVNMCAECQDGQKEGMTQPWPNTGWQDIAKVLTALGVWVSTSLDCSTQQGKEICVARDVCKPAAKRQCLSYTARSRENEPCSLMLRYPTGLRAKSSVGWLSWVFCPCSLQGRQHLHSPLSQCLHLSLYPAHLAPPSLHISVSPAPHCHDMHSAAALQREGWCWCKCSQQLQLSQAAQGRERGGEGEEGKKEERRFFIQHFEQQLAGVWLHSHSSYLDEPEREGMWLPSQRLLPIFLGFLLLLLELASQAGQPYNALWVISVTQAHPEKGGSEQLTGTSPIPGEEDTSAGDLAEPLPPLQGRTAPFLCDTWSSGAQWVMKGWVNLSTKLFQCPYPLCDISNVGINISLNFLYLFEPLSFCF